jgi:hypothetical protein
MPLRDEFSTETKDILAKRVGQQCSNPNCRRQTSGPQVHPRKTLNIGVAAHISAAAPGGPRYDESNHQRKNDALSRTPSGRARTAPSSLTMTPLDTPLTCCTAGADSPRTQHSSTLKRQAHQQIQ